MIEAVKKMHQPDFLIVGEMRCGSTSLWELIAHHPRVFFSEEKEVHFFDDREDKWSKGLNWYFGLFENAGNDQRCAEATPDYFFHPNACERIAEVLPNGRFIVILRDPVQRAWSHYWHNIRRGRETLGSFEAAIEAEEERQCDPDFAIRSHYSYVTRGHYIRRLRHWESIFGRDKILVVFLDDLKRDREVTLTRVFDHVGLESLAFDKMPKATSRNTSTYPRWPTFDRMCRRAMRAAMSIEVLVAPARKLAERTRGFRTYSGIPRIDPRTEERLRAMYDPSDRDLASWLGRPVPWNTGTKDPQ